MKKKKEESRERKWSVDIEAGCVGSGKSGEREARRRDGKIRCEKRDTFFSEERQEV